MMGLGTAGAASHAVMADRSQSARVAAARVMNKRPRAVRPIVPTLPAVEEELPTLPLPPKVKPATRIKDTRELSRVSRRQA